MPALIFDMDGVLVDSEPLHFAVEREVFADLGLHIDAHEHHALVGMTPLHIWQVLRERYQLEATAEELKQQEADRKMHHFEQQEIPLVEGVDRLLERLRTEEIPLALASSSPRRIIELFIRKTDTARFFTFTISGEEVPEGKPAPDIFLEAARRLKVPPERCTVIEDSHNGLRAALAAGMRAVGFQNPHSGQQDLGEAHLRIDRFSEENLERILNLLLADAFPG